MTNKTYNQFCAIAHTLDIVGERWALLVVRNLLIGPRRFSDLMKGLPGISTNILSDRLRVLEDQGVLQTRYLPPPAASNVYELTPRGYALADVLGALARWGSDTLGSPHAGQHIVSESIAFMILGVFQRSNYDANVLICNVHVDDAAYRHTYGVQLSQAGPGLQETALPSPDVELRIGLNALSALSSRRTTLAALQAAHQVVLAGSRDALSRLMQWVDGR